MTDQTAQEPTMEEILASIRRIISEDDAPAETAAPAPAPAPEPSPALMDETPSVQTAQAPEDDVLELTDRFSPATETIGDLDVTPAEPEPEPFPEEPSQSYFAPEEPVASTPERPSIPTPTASYDPLVGDGPAASAASAFAGLAASFRKPDPVEHTGGVGPTIDDLARQLMRPLLKEWLDANLPGIVETAVRKEVERIARTAG